MQAVLRSLQECPCAIRRIKTATIVRSTTAVESVLKHEPIGNDKYGLPRKVVFGNRLNCVEIWDILPRICSPSRQVVSHDSGLSRQVSLYSALYADR